MTNVKFGIWILIFVWILSFGFCNLTHALSVDIGGYYKNHIAALAKRDDSTIYYDLNRLRLHIISDMTPAVLLQLQPEYSFMIRSQDLGSISGLDQVIWDRSYLKFVLPAADITAGKQRIAWGTGYIWNPTDVFDPFEYKFAVSEEERRGVDAVRVEIPLGAASKVEGVVLTGNPWDKLKKGLKLKTNINASDFSLSYIYLGDNNFQLGYDNAGELWGLGVHSEAALVFPPGTTNYLRAVLGWDYTFENGLGIGMEYYYNGAGKQDKADYDWAGLFAGNLTQLGKDYVYIGLSKLLDELTQVRLTFMANAGDMSYIIYPYYSRNIIENVDLNLEALFEGGAVGGEYQPTDAEDPSGLLGSNIYFVKLRYSF